MLVEYSDYRKWLQSEIDRRIADNPMFSGNAFSKKMGLSQSYLSLVLNGKRKLTLKSAEQLASKMGLTEVEQQYLALLVQMNNAEDPKLVQHYSDELKNLRKSNKIGQLELETFKVISDWKYSAILEAINLDNLPHTDSAIAAKLGLTLSEVKSALRKLLKLGLITHVDSEYTRADSGYVTTPSEIKSQGLRQFHKQILRKAVDAVDHQDIEDRNITGITMAIDPKKLPEAKRRMQKFSEELMEFLEGGEKTEVYQLSSQLFRLSMPEERD